MHAWLKWIVVGILAVISMAGGTALSKMGADRFLEQPTKEMAYVSDRLNRDGLASFARQIEKARLSVDLSARYLTSGLILEALRKAHDSGVTVRVLLDGEVNNEIRRGALGYLRKNAIPTRLSPGRLNDQYFLVDGRALFITSAPWTPEDAQADGLAHLIVSAGAGATVRRLFDTSWNSARIP